MWPFSKRAAADDRLSTLSRRLDDVESKARTLTAEWLDTLDRIERVLGRLVKRGERERDRAASDAAAVNGADPGGQHQPPGAAADEVAVRRARFVNPAAR